MILYPPCKINLGLHIKYKREDGYHEIDSVFYPVQWLDAIEIEKNQKGIHSSFSGLIIPGDSKDNLIEKVFNIIATDHNLPGLKYHLHKNIPMGAGLGGGSADAAYAINLIDIVYQLDLCFEDKMKYASMIGSDVNFFLFNSACRCKGRGELVEPIEELSLSGTYIVLINPGIHIGTSIAYTNVHKENRDLDIQKMINSPIEEWNNFVKNDFEVSVFNEYPEIEEIKNNLYKNGASYASMSGSGSTVFGLFKEKPHLDLTQYKSTYQGILK